MIPASVGNLRNGVQLNHFHRRNRMQTDVEGTRHSMKEASPRLLTLVMPLRALGYECRNFAHRIRSIWRSPIYREGLQIGSEYHSLPSADFQPCDRIRDCILDIGLLRRAPAWITLADEEFPPPYACLTTFVLNAKPATMC